MLTIPILEVHLVAVALPKAIFALLYNFFQISGQVCLLRSLQLITVEDSWQTHVSKKRPHFLFLVLMLDAHAHKMGDGSLKLQRTVYTSG